MNQTKPNHPAFPTTSNLEDWGMTKREFFAAVALQGLLACPSVDGTMEEIAAEAVEAADELIKILNFLS